MNQSPVSRWIRGFAICVSAATTGVLAQEVTISQLKAQAPRATENITVLGQDLMGDQVNLYNGSLEFVHTDVSLRGNSALAVAFTRRHSVGRDPMIRGALGDWDIDAPYIGSTFTAVNGWINGAGNTNRCSQFSAPPTHVVTGVSYWAAEEYWQGHRLHVPGAGTQEVLLRSAANTSAPQDGLGWPLVTRDHWQIRCLPSLQNGPGEGFVAKSPDGLEYRFDWLATRAVPWLQDGTGVLLQRSEVRLMATRVSDRFGNFVTYTYNSAAPWMLTQIQGNDGRTITISYTNVGGANRVSAVSDGTRTWTYAYSAQADLDRVTLPDGSRWQFALRSLVYSLQHQLGGSATCDHFGDYPSQTLSGTITHPSGAVGSFSTAYTLHGRTAVPRVCVQKVACTLPPGGAGARTSSLGTGAGVAGSLARGPVTLRTAGNQAQTQSCISVAEYPRWPRVSAIQSLTAKTISGPALTPMTWSYSYVGGGSDWGPCPGCVGIKTVDVTDPRGFVSRHTYGNTFQVNDGQLLQVQEGLSGSTAARNTTRRYASTGPWPEPVGLSVAENAEHFSSRLRPVDQRVIQQDGAAFTWQANSFDSRARPLNVSRSSSFGASSLGFNVGGYSRTETSTWYDHPQHWVLGQLSSLTEQSTGAVMVANTYDSTNARLLTHSRFGRLQHTNTWYANGLLQSQRDAANKTTTLANYHRGVPQLVTFADNTTQSAVVNNIGGVTSLTDELGFTTSFGFDAMGRLNRVTHPSGDTNVWADTTYTVEQVAVDEYGIPAGHWRQTEATGNARTITYYDALWRPRLSRSFDASNEANTRAMVLRHYDSANRLSFQSYAQRSIASISASVPGVSSSFDALGRMSSEQRSSELGPLSTTHSYLGGFEHRVVNPRGHATASKFQAFDEPATSDPVEIRLPENVSVSIVRDVFGKPRSITRSGSFSGGFASATRSYVYDANQLLCKTIEPESGATVVDYDAAGNLAWRATGLALPSTSSCDRTSVPTPRRSTFGYDLRDRITSTSFGDGSPAITRTWWPDGKPATISTGGTVSTVWTLQFNRRRLPTSETLALAGSNHTIGWAYDANGSLASISYPMAGPVMALNPDALGRPRQFGGAASSVLHHPDGQLASFTMGNGVAFSRTLNARNLPLAVAHGSWVADSFTYDANANPSTLTDQAQGITSRSLGYDGLDRLVSANAPGLWGSASFGYDSLDNLRTSVVGSRSSVHAYDGSNRLQSITNTASTTSYAHDVQGNVTQRGARGFVFDVANRMSAATASGANLASYTYDGLGRRVRSVHSDGTTRVYVYSQAGQLLSTSTTGGPQTASTTHLGYLGGMVFVEQDSASGLQYVHTDALGSPVARTNTSGQLLSRSRFEPYGQLHSGSAPLRLGYAGHVGDADTALSYMQQRYYDPLAGRFLSVDPVVTNAKDGGFFGRYHYANNSPYAFKDPDGRAPRNAAEPYSEILSRPHEV